MSEPTPPDRLLRADLTTREITSVPVPERWRRLYLGGKGLGARYLLDELDTGVNPLGPQNVLVFMLGPLSGFLPGEPRYAAITKSPLTGGFLDSYAGGSFPARLAGALEDHIGVLVRGIASEPVQLVVEDGTARIEATDAWGRDTVETAAAIDSTVACIGPAGERLVSFATIASDQGQHHAGRGGAGTVMGSKRLKAVVARGTPPAGLERLRENYEDRYRADDATRWRRASGTLESIDFANTIGALASHGWQERRFPDAAAIGIKAIRNRSSGREHPDAADPGDYRIDTAEGESVPRGATAMSLGAGLGIDEFDSVAALGARCNKLGVDLITAGSCIAWAVRAAELGLLDRTFAFGNSDDANRLLDELVTRDTRLGDVLAEGIEVAAAEYGGADLIPTVKAMELPPYDPRGAPAMALAYATSDRGACHRRARPVEHEAFGEAWTPDEAAEWVVAEQNRRSVLWSLIVDDFMGEVFDDLGAEWLAAIGLEPVGDLGVVGERIWTLTRLFNVREGVSRADDTLPEELTSAGVDATVDAGLDPGRFDEMLDAYYVARGWGADGRPSRGLIDRLELWEAVDDAALLDQAPLERP